MVKVTWNGHSCFELKGQDLTMVTDPFKSIGLPEPRAAADIVLCSHSHYDHNNTKPVLRKNGQVFEAFTGSGHLTGITIKGVPSFHTKNQAPNVEKNSIYVFDLDGISFCHLGDLGHELSSSTIEQIGKVDVLFIPVGGHFTIGPETATTVCEQLDPRIIIPMHFRMPGLASIFDPLKTVDAFLEGKKNIDRIKGANIDIEENKLPRQTRILIMNLS